MFGPSGFFLPIDSADTGHDSDNLELLHTSEEGFNVLYRICKNGRFFVYKALKEEYRENTLYEDLLSKEFNIGFSLSHTGICQYIAKIQHPSIGSCIVMEWVDGITLEEMLKQGPIEEKLAIKIICELCDALDYMHRKQVIHRDLKPANILITHSGQHVKAIDFGLSDTPTYNTLKAPAGTRIYASPEQVAGEMIDARSDIWSLGVIINEITRKYRKIASRCTRRDKEQRFNNAIEVKEKILSQNSRKVAVVWLSIIGIVSASAISWAISSRQVTSKPQGTVVHKTDTIIITQPIPQDEVIKEVTTVDSPSAVTDELNEEELEDLFNSAAQSII